MGSPPHARGRRRAPSRRSFTILSRARHANLLARPLAQELHRLGWRRRRRRCQPLFAVASRGSPLPAPPFPGGPLR